MQSIKKKVTSILKDGLEPIEAGVYNFNHPTNDVEQLAKVRMTDCFNCTAFIDEPIKFLRVADERIPELSNKMCDECGCTLSYKLRQSKTICAKWLK